MKHAAFSEIFKHVRVCVCINAMCGYMFVCTCMCTRALKGQRSTSGSYSIALHLVFLLRQGLSWVKVA